VEMDVYERGANGLVVKVWQSWAAFCRRFMNCFSSMNREIASVGTLDAGGEGATGVEAGRLGWPRPADDVGRGGALKSTRPEGEGAERGPVPYETGDGAERPEWGGPMRAPVNV
jgi:hypothetical protein